MQVPPETQVVIDFDDNRAALALVGPYGQNLALIERRLGVVVDSRGNHITIAGSRDGCDAGRRVLETLYAQALQGHDLSQGEVEGAIRAVLSQGSLFEFDPKTAKTSFETINLRKRPVRARTAAQDSYIRALKRHEMVFGVGPAGTGKTWLAVAHAAQLFERAARNPGQIVGRTAYLQPAHVFASPDIVGQVLPVKIESLERYSLLGELAGAAARQASSTLSTMTHSSHETSSSQETQGA